MRKTICLLYAILIILSLLVQSSCAYADSDVMLEVDIHFKENLLFSKYAVSLYIDDTFISDIPHGHRFHENIKITKGSHTLHLYKSDNHSIFGEIEFNVKEYLYLDTSIETKRDKVEIKDTVCHERYDLENSTLGSLLRKGDQYALMYLNEYDVSFHAQERVKAWYTNAYIFFGTKNNKYARIDVGKGDKVEEVEPLLGTYSGSFTGTISTTTQYGKGIVYKGSGDTLSSGSFERANRTVVYEKNNINVAIWTLIHYLHPDVYDEYFNALRSIRRTCPELYETFYDDSIY